MLSQMSPSPFHVEPIHGENIFEITIQGLQGLFQIGKLTAVEYTAFCIERIRKVS